MADISIVSRLISGVQRNVDLSTNTLVVNEVKVGGGAGTVLTKAILDNLITLQNGSDIGASIHHHDGRYFTETELGSSGAASGSDLIGDDNTYSNFTPAAATIKGALSGIDSALATAGSTSFSDAAFEIYDDGDATKKILFQASGITTATSRTITMPDANVDLGNLTDSNISASAAITLSKLAALTANRAVASDASGFLTVSATTDTELGYLSGATSNIQTQLNALSTGYARRAKAIDYITDNTAAPPTEVSGDRYVLSHDGGAPNAAWDGAAAGDIVEFNGTSWVATTPLEGWRIYIDVENKDRLWVDDGTGQWEARTIDSQALSDGTLWIGDASGSAVERTISGDITISNSGVAAIGSGKVTNDMLAGSIADTKLAQDYIQTTEVDNSSIEFNGGTLNVKALGITDAMLAGSISTSKLTDAATVTEAKAFFDATDISGAEAETLTDGSNADGLHKHGKMSETLVAGEAFAANTTFFVRWAKSGETAGRVYKADYDATTNDNFYAYGVIEGNGAAAKIAGDSVEVVYIGEITLGSSDTAFAAGEVGEPVHLKAAGAFDAVSQITYTTNQASYRVGQVRTTSTIQVGNMQLLGIN